MSAENFIIIIAVLFIILFYLSYKLFSLAKTNEFLMKENFSLKQDNKKLREIERLKTEFVSIAAHQLRTPLTKIKWILRTLLSEDAGPLNNEQKELVKTGYQSNEKLISLLNDLLNVGKTEDANLGYEFKTTSIEKVIEETIKNYSFTAQQKNIKLDFIKPESPVPPMLIDPNKISLALSNLIDNAINYTPEGGAVGVILENFGNYVKIMVKDNGIGIPKKDQNKLFTRFFRADNAVRVRTEGTGLGLYIVKNIIKIHGGDVWIESEEGKGTTVHLVIPFRTRKEVEKSVEEFIKNL